MFLRLMEIERVDWFIGSWQQEPNHFLKDTGWPYLCDTFTVFS